MEHKKRTNIWVKYVQHMFDESHTRITDAGNYKTWMSKLRHIKDLRQKKLLQPTFEEFKAKVQPVQPSTRYQLTKEELNALYAYIREIRIIDEKEKDHMKMNDMYKNYFTNSKSMQGVPRVYQYKSVDYIPREDRRRQYAYRQYWFNMAYWELWETQIRNQQQPKTFEDFRQLIVTTYQTKRDQYRQQRPKNKTFYEFLTGKTVLPLQNPFKSTTKRGPRKKRTSPS